jgi:ribonucleoside-diphosphate reductase alpha chain
MNKMVIKRDGNLVDFDINKIALAVLKAYIAVYSESVAQSVSVREKINQISRAVVESLEGNNLTNTVKIEEIQDQVELFLMHFEEYKVLRAYILYREEKRQKRNANQANDNFKLEYIDDHGNKKKFDSKIILQPIKEACANLDNVDPSIIEQDTLKNLYSGVSIKEIDIAVILSARQMIEKEPNYNYVTARLLLYKLYKEVLGRSIKKSELKDAYISYFYQYIEKGIKLKLLNPALADFDLTLLASALIPDNDYNFKYLGLQTLYDRYFIHDQGTRIELPQIFFMRVAMGLALKEQDFNQKAIEFYQLISSFDFMPSTPTLFNSGTLHSQLSSCYLSTVGDSLVEIYDSIKENALLSKFAGGLGNDWTPVRSMGSYIQGTNGKSQGVIPFLKVVNDTAVAVNQGGKRKGAACVYLETWHADIEEFLELRKNTGDDRRRCHDINTANWIPDLFMKRVMNGEEWSLFSPHEADTLHDAYGHEFEALYLKFEALGKAGKLSYYKQIPALTLWRKMLTMLFETGHPWITFKDPCNIRSAQQHVGVVHSSNLCTEITLNTNDEEIAVCNLGSINLASHINSNGIDHAKLKNSIKTAIRMLDNVIDINFYPVDKARNSNIKHRPIGMGMMGFQDCLYKMKINYTSSAAMQFADEITEVIAYYAYESSSDLSVERGVYSSYNGSLWDQGILPLDSLKQLAKIRGDQYAVIDTSAKLDWSSLRYKIKTQGMRNSNCLAIAPTATIANIIGVTASIEPTYQNLFVKSNLSGEFTVVNEFLVQDLKNLGLWDEMLLADLKYFNGSLMPIDRIPEHIKQQYLTAFEIDPQYLITAAARRQKWIDQAQSLNLYVANASGKKLDQVYKYAWLQCLKTTYYLRTLSASSIEKSTEHRMGGELNAVQVSADTNNIIANSPQLCSIDNPECESCQ